MSPRLPWILLLLLPVFAAGQTYTYSTFVTFPAKNGPFGAGKMIIDTQGNLYAASPYGGLNSSNFTGDGTVYMVTPKGGLKVLYNFGATPTDGIQPNGPLTRDAAGNLYGTTSRGGAYGQGTVFKVTPEGGETVLLSFPGDQTGYTVPGGGVTLDPKGNIYGYVTRWKQFNPDGGDIFKLTPAGVYSIVYTFCTTNCNVKTNSPIGTLTNKLGGGFYGATANAGIGDPDGVVFELSPQGRLDTLYSFTPPGGPTSGVVVDAAGNLFGIAQGSVYEITPAGVESTIYTFNSRYGYNGYGPPILDAEGNLYDTTETNAPLDIVFKVSPAGVETVLYTGESVDPTGVVMDQAGNLYTTCSFCGFNHSGVIGKLTKSAN